MRTSGFKKSGTGNRVSIERGWFYPPDKMGMRRTE
jgi:hypothetical protein